MAVGDNMPIMSASSYSAREFALGGGVAAAPFFKMDEPPRHFTKPGPVLDTAAKILNLLEQNTMEQNTKRRLVNVIVADPNENIPLDQCVLYNGQEQLTDLQDQELYFEIDIKSLLDAHNSKRILIVDKTVKDRIEHLEPAKVRDLKMVVVTIAQF